MNACGSWCGFCGRCTDHDDALSNWGIERTCAGCGQPVMVEPREDYTLQVYCPTCQVALMNVDQPRRRTA